MALILADGAYVVYSEHEENPQRLAGRRSSPGSTTSRGSGGSNCRGGTASSVRRIRSPSPNRSSSTCKGRSPSNAALAVELARARLTREALWRFLQPVACGAAGADRSGQVIERAIPESAWKVQTQCLPGRVRIEARQDDQLTVAHTAGVRGRADAPNRFRNVFVPDDQRLAPSARTRRCSRCPGNDGADSSYARSAITSRTVPPRTSIPAMSRTSWCSKRLDRRDNQLHSRLPRFLPIEAW